MLDQSKLLEALRSKQDQFTAYDRSIMQHYRRFRDGVGQLGERSRADVEAALADTDWPGAWPTQEYDGDFAISYNHGWSSAKAAIEWGLDAVGDIPCFAIDGSQIWVERDLSIPVAVTQVGWYENRRNGEYEKQIAMELLTPDELTRMVEREKGSRSAAYGQLIGLRRHTFEVETLTDYIESQADAREKPVCFFDGPLVLSYADRASPDRQRAYVDPMCRMLAASERNRVPVFGYIDSSNATDLVTMLATLFDWQVPTGLSDAWILSHYLRWGERSQAYVCAREGILEIYRDPDTGRRMRDQVCFLYLQPEEEELHPPARVEFPRWMLETDELERAIQVVLADAIYGDGYPYAVGAADEVAVLDQRDWEDFTEIVRQFLDQQAGIELRWSRKRDTKRIRRR